jgi:RNA polymerase sigma-70 factor (ECF subfamily)
LDLAPHVSSERPAPARPHSPAAPDVEALTQRLVAGDERAYRMFHDLYIDRLTRYLLVVTAGDEQAAREALQGALTRMVRHIRVFTDEAVFWSWLTVLARTAHADDRRKRRRYLAFLDRFTRQVEVESAGSSDQSGDDRLDESLARQVTSLPVEERELIAWKYTERRSVRDIAAQLQLTEKAVESRLTRVRQKLKAALLADLRHEPLP